ncbi:MAG: threonine synthase, partial [Clostridia bacterium]|nr:threonine synthase [Clostridia bacterium]
MAFFSTRAGKQATASQAILYGLAADGGLFVPAQFPQVSLEQVASLSHMTYPQRAACILQYYLEDYTPEQIQKAVEGAYGGGKFDCPEVAPVKRLDDTTFALELFHGPTLAFKDMALQLLPHLVTQAARMNGEERQVSILVATSGDTGKA